MTKTKNYLPFALILVFCFAIRLINIDKVNGFWHDEITSYTIANALPDLNINFHRFLLFPLYFIIYKIWILFFGTADITIRLMSVFFDTLSLIVAFFIGLQFSKKTALFFSLLYAINASFIYYSQEAKFYSLTFFLLNLNVLSFLKYIENQNKKNTIFFILSNFLLLYTQTTLCLLNILFLITTSIILHKKGTLKLSFVLEFISIFLPLIIFIITFPKYFSGNFDIVFFDNSFIFLVLQNWFSPVLAGLQNNIPNYQNVILSNLLNFKFILYIIFPIIFMTFAFIYGIVKSKQLRYLSIIPICFILFHIIISQGEQYHANVRYTLIILPIILLICSFSLSQMCKNLVTKIIFTIFVLTSILVLISPLSPTKITRPISYKNLAEFIISNKISPDNTFIMPIGTELLEKYYKINGKKYSFYTLNSIDAQKTYLTENEIYEINQKHDLTKNYTRYLLSKSISKDFELYIMNTFKPQKKLVYIVDKGICMFSNQNIENIIKTNKPVPIQFLRLSKLNNDIISVLSKNYIVKTEIENENWKIYVFEIPQSLRKNSLTKS